MLWLSLPIATLYSASREKLITSLGLSVAWPRVTTVKLGMRPEEGDLRTSLSIHFSSLAGPLIRS